MKKHTSRELQALKAKQKIYEAAVELCDKNGFENTTIADIARKTGMSVGSFYHYYSSKGDIYYEFFIKIDEYYAQTVEPQLVAEDFYDDVILFFKHYALYIIERGPVSVGHLFRTQDIFFISNERYMYKLLTAILNKGKANNQLASGMDVAEIADFLRVIARGIVYDWLLHEGDHDLEAKMVRSITLIMRKLISGSKAVG
jgi:AcrR family transcriptional regulator